MKRLLAGILAAALMATAGVVGVSAAGRGMQGAQAGARYVDANNDGVCDTCGRLHCRFVDANGDGVCDNCGTGLGAGCGHGIGWVDADNDGVCDNRGTGLGMGCGHGSGWVDANGDGVCDNRGTGCGMGRGACGGRGR